MFELTDLWCETSNINEYMHFTEDMHNIIDEWQEEEEENSASEGLVPFPNRGRVLTG